MSDKHNSAMPANWIHSLGAPIPSQEFPQLHFVMKDNNYISLLFLENILLSLCETERKKEAASITFPGRLEKLFIPRRCFPLTEINQIIKILEIKKIV